MRFRGEEGPSGCGGVKKGAAAGRESGARVEACRGEAPHDDNESERAPGGRGGVVAGLEWTRDVGLVAVARS